MFVCGSCEISLMSFLYRVSSDVLILQINIFFSARLHRHALVQLLHITALHNGFYIHASTITE